MFFSICDCFLKLSARLIVVALVSPTSTAKTTRFMQYHQVIHTILNFKTMDSGRTTEL